MEIRDCCLCNDVAEIIPLVQIIKGKEVKTFLCPRHMKMAKGQTSQKEEQKPQNEVTLCCGTPIRNGRCQISGKLYEDC